MGSSSGAGLIIPAADDQQPLNYCVPERRNGLFGTLDLCGLLMATGCSKKSKKLPEFFRSWQQRISGDLPEYIIITGFEQRKGVSQP